MNVKVNGKFIILQKLILHLFQENVVAPSVYAIFNCKFCKPQYTSAQKLRL